MTTPEPTAQPEPRAAMSNPWRDTVQSAIESAYFDGFSLEHLIDRHRDSIGQLGEQR